MGRLTADIISSAPSRISPTSHRELYLRGTYGTNGEHVHSNTQTQNDPSVHVSLFIPFLVHLFP